MPDERLAALERVAELAAASTLGTILEHDTAASPRAVALFFETARAAEAFLAAITEAIALPPSAPSDLFVDGVFTAHSGGMLYYKIECDNLSDASIACLAQDYARRHKFGSVRGVPRGGLRLAAALEPYITEGPPLIADDVLTTGGSMEEARAGIPNARGVVIFARGPCPAWIEPLWQSPTDTAVWPHTKDSLPEIGEPVLIYRPADDRHPVCEAVRLIEHEGAARWYWSTPGSMGGRGDAILPESVTRWRPLPAPPEETR